jgi:EAL domain-containing protein (putative c-di-GMP-specific phosphodiesterase class I)
MGVKLALDDFGTGYSSLNYLSRFRLDALKIDRSFIIELETNQRCRDLTRHIIGMGKTLGLVLVAEGVETQAQADLLSQFGCEQLQGYLFSRPLAAAELGRQLELSHG